MVSFRTWLSCFWRETYLFRQATNKLILIIGSLRVSHHTVCPLSPQVSSKDEDFLDLSVDVEQNTSITHCLR